MSKLRIEKGASRARRVPLKTTIDGTVWDDVELMCQWSENDTSYIVNNLLRFALSQSEGFQQHKQSLEKRSPTTTRQQQPDAPAAPIPVVRTTETGR
jgi:hypothetical protein